MISALKMHCCSPVKGPLDKTPCPGTTTAHAAKRILFSWGWLQVPPVKARHVVPTGRNWNSSVRLGNFSRASHKRFSHGLRGTKPPNLKHSGYSSQSVKSPSAGCAPHHTWSTRYIGEASCQACRTAMVNDSLRAPVRQSGRHVSL